MIARRMDAYYYDFEFTKNASIDKILGAVACAGKAYHHTQDWCEKTSPYDDHTGETPTEWIQNAALEAADEIERLRAENDRLRWSLDPFIRSLEIQESEWRIRDWPELQNMDRLAYAMIGDARRARAALEEKK
jgi:hypothetical protein